MEDKNNNEVRSLIEIMRDYSNLCNSYYYRIWSKIVEENDKRKTENRLNTGDSITED